MHMLELIFRLFIKLLYRLNPKMEVKLLKAMHSSIARFLIKVLIQFWEESTSLRIIRLLLKRWLHHQVKRCQSLNSVDRYHRLTVVSVMHLKDSLFVMTLSFKLNQLKSSLFVLKLLRTKQMLQKFRTSKLQMEMWFQDLKSHFTCYSQRFIHVQHMCMHFSKLSSKLT